MLECECQKEPVLKHYLLKFSYNKSNGWAIVNAHTVNQAQSIFKVQTRFNGAKVDTIEELRYYGEEIQLVYEGTLNV